MADHKTMPMFPLGSVLFPTLVLPLHLFEPRYLALIRDVLAGDREFGVVLIERGTEVGGGDVRSGIGTVASVQESAELPDGRWAVVTVGTRRLRVLEWLPDDPYPRAVVESWPDPEPAEVELTLLPTVVERLRRTLSKAAALGEAQADPAVVLSEDPVVASHQISALAPLPILDRQVMLAAPTLGMRLAQLDAALADAEAMLDLRAGP